MIGPSNHTSASAPARTVRLKAVGSIAPLGSMMGHRLWDGNDEKRGYPHGLETSVDGNHAGHGEFLGDFPLPAQRSRDHWSLVVFLTFLGCKSEALSTWLLFATERLHVARGGLATDHAVGRPHTRF